MMSNHRVFQLFLMIMIVWFVSCGTDSGPEMYMITANTSPVEAGEVSPASAEIEEGNSHTIQAAAYEGWEFIVWTGGIETPDNPLTFIVDQNMTLTANFIDIRSVYSVELELFDGVDRIIVEFGQKTDASVKNELVPPTPPEGVLHAYLYKDGKQWWTNYERDLRREVEWELHFQRGKSEAITLDWQLQVQKMEGNIILIVGNDNIDLNQQNNFVLTAEIESPIKIQYQF